MRFVHIAGTNGKGSVALKLQRALQADDRKVGLFTSPHLLSFRERVVVDDQRIEQQFLADTLPTLYALAEKHAIKSTFFDYIMALALKYFEHRKVDLVSWETGLGGRLDSTNIVDTTIVSVITSIGLDHQHVLGNTIQEIAYEKAGIIKKKTPVIIGYNARPYSVFLDEASKLQAPIHIVDRTPSSFEEENNDIVRLCVHQLNKIQPNCMISEHWLKKGLEARQPCRMELIKRDGLPSIYLDVGHNITAIEQLVRDVQSAHPDKSIVYIYGASSYKAVQPILQKLAESCSTIYLVAAKHFRAMKMETLVSQIPEKSKNFQVLEGGDVHKTLESVLKNTSTDSVIIIGGTFYLMAEVRKHFGSAEECDPEELSRRV